LKKSEINQLNESQLSNINRAITDLLLLSAKTGVGVEQLTDSLLNLINTGALRNNETIVTNSRHYDALLKAFEEIQKVKYGLETGLSGDLLAIDIRQALYHFGEITNYNQRFCELWLWKQCIQIRFIGFPNRNNKITDIYSIAFNFSNVFFGNNKRFMNLKEFIFWKYG